jgi:hypothetical protein
VMRNKLPFFKNTLQVHFLKSLWLLYLSFSYIFWEHLKKSFLWKYLKIAKDNINLRKLYTTQSIELTSI